MLNLVVFKCRMRVRVYVCVFLDSRFFFFIENYVIIGMFFFWKLFFIEKM